MVTPTHPAGPPRLTEDEFAVLYRLLRSRATWASGEGGPLDALTPDRVVAAPPQQVRTGRTVTLAAPVRTMPGPNPPPARHRMSGQPDEDVSAVCEAEGLWSLRCVIATLTAALEPLRPDEPGLTVDALADPQALVDQAVNSVQAVK